MKANLLAWAKLSPNLAVLKAFLKSSIPIYPVLFLSAALKMASGVRPILRHPLEKWTIN